MEGFVLEFLSNFLVIAIQVAKDYPCKGFFFHSPNLHTSFLFIFFSKFPSSIPPLTFNDLTGIVYNTIQSSKFNSYLLSPLNECTQLWEFGLTPFQCARKSSSTRSYKRISRKKNLGFQKALSSGYQEIAAFALVIFRRRFRSLKVPSFSLLNKVLGVRRSNSKRV